MLILESGWFEWASYKASGSWITEKITSVQTQGTLNFGSAINWLHDTSSLSSAKFRMTS